MLDRLAAAWKALMGGLESTKAAPKPPGAGSGAHGMGFSGMPVGVPWTLSLAKSEVYDRNSWARRCIDENADIVTMATWRAQVRDASESDTEKWIDIPNHPLAQLWAQPNPFMSQGELLGLMVRDLLLCGNAIVVKLRDSAGRPAELWRMNPDTLKPVPHPTRWVERYEVTDSNVIVATGVRAYDPRDVIHWRLPDPVNPLWGCSPLLALARAIDTDSRTVEWNWRMMQNRMRPQGALKLKGEVSQARYDSVYEAMRRKLGPDGAGIPMVLDGETEWLQLDGGSSELDYLGSRQFTLREICAVLRVPPPIIGILDDATYSNYNTAFEVFVRTNAVPRLDSLMELLNRELVRDFTVGEGNDAPLRLNYELAAASAFGEATARKVTAAQNLVSIGVPLNDALRFLDLGLLPVMGGEVGLINGGLVPIGLHSGVPDAGAGEPLTGTDDEDTTTNNHSNG